MSNICNSGDPKQNSTFLECQDLIRRKGTFCLIKTNEILDANNCQPFVYFEVDTADSEDGPSTSGPVRLFNHDLLRFVSPGNSVVVNPGSARVMTETVSNIGKIWLRLPVIITTIGDFSNLVVPPTTHWTVAFQNYGVGDSLLQNSHLFVVPSTLNSCAFIEIDVLAKVIIEQLNSPKPEAMAGVVILKNGEPVSFSCVSGSSDIITSVHLHDIIPCLATDELDIGFFNLGCEVEFIPSFEGGFPWIDSGLNGISYATFKFAGYDISSDCSVTPPPPIIT